MALSLGLVKAGFAPRRINTTATVWILRIYGSLRLTSTPILTNAPGNGAPIGGLKVIAASGWFAARPSGTENIYKIYAESFRDANHLTRVSEEAQTIVSEAVAEAVH